MCSSDLDCSSSMLLPEDDYLVKKNLEFIDSNYDWRSDSRRFHDLAGLWDDRWASMLDDDGKTPAARVSLEGMKFCLMVLVCRYGLTSGTRNMKGELQAVSWKDACESASFLLAITVLAGLGSIAGGLNCIPWTDVIKNAQNIDREGRENPADLKNHGEREGIEGFRKRLAATMLVDDLKKATKLAAAFETQTRKSMANFRRNDHLQKWFPD